MINFNGPTTVHHVTDGSVTDLTVHAPAPDVAALQARIAALEVALRPLTLPGVEIHTEAPDDYEAYAYYEGDITVGDVRRARALLGGSSDVE